MWGQQKPVGTARKANNRQGSELCIFMPQMSMQIPNIMRKSIHRNPQNISNGSQGDRDNWY